MIKYHELRNIAELCRTKNPGSPNPCIRGRAECCIDVGIVPGDWKLLKEGLERGIISPERWSRALERVKAASLLAQSGAALSRCPFLTEARDCAINRVKPLLCMSNDFAFHFNYARVTPEEGERLLRQVERDPTISFQQELLNSRLCAHCQQEVAARKEPIPGTLVFFGGTLERYLNSQPMIRMSRLLLTIGNQVLADLHTPARHIGDYSRELASQAQLVDKARFPGRNFLFTFKN